MHDRRDERRSSAFHRLTAVSAFCACLSIACAAEANLARSGHFEVYAQTDEAGARSVLVGFERLRTFLLQQTGLPFDNRPPVRVIVFRTVADYDRYRLRPAADAFYVGTQNRDTIAMVNPAGGDFRVATHEFAHAVLHANSIELPAWLNEGLPEVFSTLRVEDRGSRMTSELPPRSRVLKSHTWMPLEELVTLAADSPLRDRRDTSAVFYAESWALTDMLMVGPQYSSHFSELFAALSSGTPTATALLRIYAKSLDEVTRDLRAWVDARRVTPAALPALSPETLAVQVSEVSQTDWESVLADLLLATGKLDQAHAAYEQLARQAPQNANFSAALATIALQRRDWPAARRQWQQALDQGLDDAAACYRYAVLAGQAGLGAEEIRPALERAVAVQPNFDDVHFMLALMENNLGRYQAAVEHLRAMVHVSPSRQHSYWAALSYAYSELGKRDEAKLAAAHALEHASTPAERLHATQLAEIAQTDLAARFIRDANGNSRLVMTRVPHDAPDFNPFIEPSDRIRRIEGKLREISCSGNTARMIVETSTSVVTIAIPDPSRVLIRDAPAEFICGPQPLTIVIVVYAESENAALHAAGIARGIEFR